jgi:predicted transposase YdaD
MPPRNRVDDNPSPLASRRVSSVVTSTPHDALVRAIFGQPDYAAQELLAVLPQRVRARIRLDTLALIEGSFIDEELRESSADLLFNVGLKRGGSGLVYVLFEHQSTHDERMPLRLLRYQTRIWERYAAAHPTTAKFPPVVPLLLHHGANPWPWQPRFSSILALDDVDRADFGRSLLDFDFALDALARQSDAEILSRGSDAVVRLTLLALRNGRSHPRLHELMAAAMKALRNELRGPDVIPAIHRLARYALEVGDSPMKLVRAAFANALGSDDRSEVMVSTADQLRTEALCTALLQLLEVKFGEIDASIRTRIEQASLEQVKAWLPRVVVVSTPEEIFES